MKRKRMRKPLVALLLAMLLCLAFASTAFAVLDTGHPVNVRFMVLYVDSAFPIGYNYGASENTTFICQYSVPHSDTAYSNHTIAIADIRAAANRLQVNQGYEITGWTKTASANPTVYSLYLTQPTACNKGDTIYLVAKNPNPATPTPTPTPTVKPTPTPTVKPTAEPTAIPTMEPTPTVAPTPTPGEPTPVAPTPTASEDPAPSPSGEPTAEPTDEPTGTPAVPTATPGTTGDGNGSQGGQDEDGKDAFLIIASSNEGGSISPAGQISVPAGGEQTFAFMPDAGYALQDVLVDGVSVGAAERYTFTAVDADHTIQAVFVAETATPKTGDPAAAVALAGVGLLSLATLAYLLRQRLRLN